MSKQVETNTGKKQTLKELISNVNKTGTTSGQKSGVSNISGKIVTDTTNTSNLAGTNSSLGTPKAYQATKSNVLAGTPSTNMEKAKLSVPETVNTKTELAKTYDTKNSLQKYQSTLSSIADSSNKSAQKELNKIGSALDAGAKYINNLVQTGQNEAEYIRGLKNEVINQQKAENWAQDETNRVESLNQMTEAEFINIVNQDGTINDFTKDVESLQQQLNRIDNDINKAAFESQKSILQEERKNIQSQLDYYTNLNKKSLALSEYLQLKHFEDIGDTKTVEKLREQFSHKDDTLLQRFGTAQTFVLGEFANEIPTAIDQMVLTGRSEMAEANIAEIERLHDNGELSDEAYLEALKEWDSKIEQYKEDYYDGVSQKIQEAVDLYGASTFYNASELEQFALQVGISNEQFLLHFVTMTALSGEATFREATKVGGDLATYSMGLASQISKYNTLLAAGYDPRVCFQDSLLTGAASTITEKVGMDRFVNMLGTPVSASIIGQILWNNAKSGVSEGAEEIAEDMLVSLIDNLVLGNDVEVNGDELMTEFLLGGTSGLVMAGVADVGSMAIDYANVTNSLNERTQARRNVMDEFGNLIVADRKQYNLLRQEIEVLMSNYDTSTPEQKVVISELVKKAENSLAQYEASSISMGVVFSTDAVENVPDYEKGNAIREAVLPQINTNMQTSQKFNEIQGQIESKIEQLAIDRHNFNTAAQQLLDSNGYNIRADVFNNLSEDAKNQALVALDAAKALGIDAEVVNNLPEGVNGFVDNGFIVVDGNKRPILSTLSHELTHGTESSKYYPMLKQLVESKFTKEAWNAEIEKKIADYKNGLGKDLSIEEAEKEIVARYVEDYLGNEKFVNDLIKYNYSLVSRIIQDLKAFNNNNEIIQIQNTFEKAFADNYQQNGEQMSFTKEKDFNEAEYNELQDNRKGLTPEEIRTIQNNLLFNDARGLGVTYVPGKIVTVYSKGNGDFKVLRYNEINDRQTIGTISRRDGKSIDTEALASNGGFSNGFSNSLYANDGLVNNTQEQGLRFNGTGEGSQQNRQNGRTNPLTNEQYKDAVRRYIEKHGGGNARFSYDSNSGTYYATIAPYLDTRLNEDNRQELVEMAEGTYDAAAKDIAEFLGIKNIPKAENIGGFENEAGERLRELSWTYKLEDVTPEQAKMFASLMGDLAYENQEATICMQYINDDTHKIGEVGEDGGTYGKEFKFKFNDLKTVEESLKNADIANYNIDRKTNTLTVQDFGFDDSLPDKLDILLEGGNYESSEERPIYSYYLQREARKGIYEAQLGSEENGRGSEREGLAGNNSGPVSNAFRRVSDVIEKKASGQESPFLRRSNGDLNVTEEDLKNYRTISNVTDRQYNNDKNIDTATGVVKPEAIVNLNTTIDRTTHEAEITDGEQYAIKFAEQLDAGADPQTLIDELKANPLDNGLVRAYYTAQVLADRGLTDEYKELAQWARDIDNLGGKLVESTKILYGLEDSFSRAIYLEKVQQNLIDEYKIKYGKKSKIDIDQTINDIFSAYYNDIINAKTVREFRTALGALVRKANQAMPKTIWDRITQYRMWAMLSGSKTAVGNFVSNVASLGLYRMNSFNQAVLESAMKEIEIKRPDEVKTYKIEQSQRNATLNKDSKVSKKNRAIAKEVWKQIGEDVKSKYGEETEKIPDIVKKNILVKNDTLRSPFMRGLDTVTDVAQRIQNVLLNDAPVAKWAFTQKFDELAQVRGIDLNTIDKNSKQYNKLIDDAYDYAEEVVSHNTTDISNTLSNIQKRSSTNVRVNEGSFLEGLDKTIKNIKEKSNQGEIAYQFLDQTMMKLQKWFVPFYKTNASIFQKGLQYSPLEWAQVVNDYNKVKKGRMDLVDMVEHMSKAVTGTELYLLGAIFGYLGWLKWDKDDEDYSGRLAIKVPGTDMGYTGDFIDPVSTIFAKGVALSQEISENGLSFKTLQNLVLDYEDIFLSDELDMFSNMKDFFDTVGKIKNGEDDYGEYTLSDGATDISFSLLNSYIPAIVRDVSRIIDPAKKVVYDDDNKKYLFNRLLNSTPFRNHLVNKMDATGNTITYTQPFTKNDMANRVITQMVSRGKLVDMNGKTIQGRTDESVLGEKAGQFNQMAQDFPFSDENGDGYSDAHWIRETVPANIYPGGEKVELNPEERDEYGKTWTNTWTAGANSLADNKVYQDLDYEKQADVVYELQAFARECIEADYCKANGIEMTKAQKTADAIRKFCTTDGKVDGYILSLIALGTAKENKLESGGQQYVLAQKDKDGKTVKNSRQLYMRQLYEEAGIYDEILEAIKEDDNLTYADFGLSKTVVEKLSKEDAKSQFNDAYSEVMNKTSGKSSSSKKSSKSSGTSSGSFTSKTTVKGGGSSKTKSFTVSAATPKQTKLNDNFIKAYSNTFGKGSKTTTGSNSAQACPNCGARVSANASRCPNCGAKL